MNKMDVHHIIKLLRKFILYGLFTLIILCHLGCGSMILYPFYGIKKPKKDTEIEAQKLLSKYNHDTLLSYFINPIYVDSLKSEKFNLNTYKIKNGIEPSVLQLRMYEPNGHLIYGWEQCLGSLGRSKILDSIPFKKRTSFNEIINYDLNLYNDLKLILHSEKNKTYLDDKIANSDYVVVVFYVSWTGWFTKDMLHRLQKYKMKFNEKKLSFIFVNISS